jgi:hypothetical protein
MRLRRKRVAVMRGKPRGHKVSETKSHGETQ